MQPRSSRQSAHDQGVRRPDDDAGLDAELAAVIAGARRRAVRDGDRQIDTAHLLHSLLEADPEVRAVIGDAPKIARLLGYLVQRSIGYGLRWQSTVEYSGAISVVKGGAPRSADPKGEDPKGMDPAGMDPMGVDATGRDAKSPRPKGVEPSGAESRDADNWSPLATAAMEHARGRAGRRGDARARGADLLAGIVVDPQARAVEVLGRAGVDPRALLARIESHSGEYARDGGAAR